VDFPCTARQYQATLIRYWTRCWGRLNILNQSDDLSAETPDSGAIQDHPSYTEHQGEGRQYVRDAMLGVNDGLVSLLLLVLGVVGGNFTATQVLAAAVAASIAGAVSMAAGEYLATKTQEDVLEAEIALEREHIKQYRDYERADIRERLTGIVGDRPEVDQLLDSLMKDPEAMLRLASLVEFGIAETERRSPIRAMVVSAVSFGLGSLPSTLPFVFTDSVTTGAIVASAATGVALFVVGVARTRATARSWFASGVENLGIAALGGAASYAIGVLLDQ